MHLCIILASFAAFVTVVFLLLLLLLRHTMIFLLLPFLHVRGIIVLAILPLILSGQLMRIVAWVCCNTSSVMLSNAV